MNVSKIVEMALKQLGVLAPSENAEASELADALYCLQSMLAQWATHRLYVHKAIEINIPLTKGVNTYLIGKIEGDCCEYEVTCCGDVLERPDVKAEISHIAEYALLDDERITLMRDKNYDHSNAKVIFQEDYPNWCFNVKEGGKLLKVKAFTLPYDLCDHDELHIPPKYERPLILSLALEIAPMFGVEPSVLLIKNQSNAIEMLKRSNSVPIYSNNDIPAGVRNYGCSH